MRELTTQDVEVISGAGVFRDLTGRAGEKTGGFIGDTLGAFVEGLFGRDSETPSA